MVYQTIFHTKEGSNGETEEQKKIKDIQKTQSVR